MPVAAPTLELLAWLRERERSYAETMAAWRTSCPRLSVWEDALADGLVRIARTGSAPSVVLTPRGETLLDGPGFVPTKKVSAESEQEDAGSRWTRGRSGSAATRRSSAR